MGLASASKNAPFLLRKLEVENFFETIVDPATLSNGKPNPEIFVKGAKQLGLPVSECVGIEDSYSGIQAINGAGMFSVGVGDRGVLSDAKVVYSSTAQLDVDTIVELAR
ncbi:HAD-IA family hydrolase [Bacillus sp. Au-Bac7]|nr:HAD-IA family hydrolase [Bacillus sp. Au-Bac7]